MSNGHPGALAGQIRKQLDGPVQFESGNEGIGQSYHWVTHYFFEPDAYYFSVEQNKFLS